MVDLRRGRHRLAPEQIELAVAQALERGPAIRAQLEAATYEAITQ